MTRAAVPAMAGTICIALAPVPMIATRLPVTSRSAGQRAEWKIGPVKSPSPGRSGTFGRFSCPTAVITALASSVSPPAVVTVQRCRASSQTAVVTSVPKRITFRRSWSSATSRR